MPSPPVTTLPVSSPADRPVHTSFMPEIMLLASGGRTLIKSSVAAQTVTYLNSGDWVESLTALEYQQGEWSIFDYQKAVFEDEPSEESQTETEELEGQLNVK